MPKVIISNSPAVVTTSVLAFLLLLVIAGCGCEQAAATLPMVVSVTPANGAIAVPVVLH